MILLLRASFTLCLARCGDSAASVLIGFPIMYQIFGYSAGFCNLAWWQRKHIPPIRCESGGNAPPAAAAGGAWVVSAVQPPKSPTDPVRGLCQRSWRATVDCGRGKEFTLAGGDRKRPDQAAPERATASQKLAAETISSKSSDFFDFSMGNDPTRKVWH